MSYKTDQETFWAGEFGDSYTERNTTDDIFSSNLAFFSRILSKTSDIRSILELGANAGLNLHALKTLLPHASRDAVEINAKAVSDLQVSGVAHRIFHSSILDFEPHEGYELVFTKGVLIHIAPEMLEKVYDVIYRSTKRYALVAEYYNPSPTSISYRGHEERLFKRDFAGELMARFPDLRLIDYGFVYRRDPNFPQDDLTWFLLEKSQ